MKFEKKIVIYLLIFLFYGCSKKEKGENMILKYILTDDISSFSLSPYDSDALSNLTIMEQVVGTLVKYEPNGRYGGFLAEKWYVEDEGKKWIFILRDGLVNEDGTEINAQNYLESFNIILKKLAYEDKLPTFDLLEGWEKYIKGEEKIKGIIAKDKRTLIFKFNQMPDGIIEYLAMPYYGYYSANDFKVNGDWKDKSRITSSGSYKVEKIGTQEIILTKRNLNFLQSKRRPSKVHVKNKNFELALQEDTKYSIILKKLDNQSIPSHFKMIKGTPTILTSLVFSPFIKNVFDDIENRKLFISEFIKLQNDQLFKSHSAIIDNQFFVNFPSRGSFPISNKEQLKAKTKDPLKIIFSAAISNNEDIYIKKIISKILERSQIEYTFLKEDRSDPLWLEKQNNNNFYDIRVARVDTGSVIDNFIIKMMFCSKLGISFPDPYSRLCDLTMQNEKGLVNNEEFLNKFNQIYREDAAVLPVFHSGLTWLFTKDINLKSVSSTMGLPRFDLLELD